ncbi:hypothetical protein Tco_1537836, partial [Tanacetum coccineum]
AAAIDVVVAVVVAVVFAVVVVVVVVVVATVVDAYATAAYYDSFTLQLSLPHDKPNNE